MKILFMQKRLLLPANTGGKIRTLNVVRHLARWHDVTYVSNVLEEEQPYLNSMRGLGLRLESIPWREASRKSLRFAMLATRNLASRYPLNVDKDYDPRLRRRAEELLKSEPFDLLVCDFVQMARNAIDLPIPSVLFQHNVEAEVFLRQAQRRRGPMRWYLGHQAAKMRRFERDAGAAFSRVIAVSERDRQLFESDYGWKHVSVIDTAVDTEYFLPTPETHSKPNHVVFVGSMDWAPNVEGVQHFARKIWPLVRARIPEASFTIVGRNPPPSIRRLQGRLGVSVTGSVNDTRPYLTRASVGVVPIYAGGGTRLKIFEMIAMGRAVVSTSLGAEGLGLRDGEQILLCDNDEAFAKGVIDLLQDDQRRQTLAEHALQVIGARHTAEKVAGQFNAICEDVIGSAGSGHR
ncbi:glycosyltransferase [Roseiconus nitratireducens]|uniref:Glycosyltransferase n=1 Tax=Roseiconus nitratireducens TaxID=2605748 RepID=A0A5M6DFS7_9BACT|nr:glycosyltransferase family 4 protein [Roseiconus nitratireducens]KAA5546263.1 glycosyltransferase [Roseiconus nitratireducens]